MSSSQGFKPEWLPSPNFNARKNNQKPRFIVIHYTAMDTCEAAIGRLCTPLHEVSCHYLISGKGMVYQLIKENERAWHAGAGEWKGLEDLNSHSIGIELANQGNHPYALPQIYSLEAVLRHLMSTWAIPIHNIIGHSDMAIGRKFDPGYKFDWRALALNNLSIWPKKETSEAVNVSEFVSLAKALGYSFPNRGSDKGSIKPLLECFRARFRPWARGELNSLDMGCVHSLVFQDE